MDDGSADGTAAAIRESFVNVRLEHFADSEGYIVRRNQAASLAAGEILVSIDDDAEFSSEDVVATTLASFDEPRVGAVAIPYVDLPDETVQQRAPDSAAVHLIHRFRGTAYAVRRRVFADLGGFNTTLFHQAEEADFSLRLLDAGYVVRLGTAAPIRHHVSANRDVERMWFYECRNDILFAWHNVPMPNLLPQLVKTTLHLLWLGRGVRRTGFFARGLLAGYGDALRDRGGRRPVAGETWKLYSRLGKRRTTLEDIRVLLRTQAPRPAATA